METGIIGSWTLSPIVVNLIVLLEISCAITALFGKFSKSQSILFIIVSTIYLINLITSVNSNFYQDYTFLYFGQFYINFTFLIILIILTFLSNKAFSQQKSLLKPYYQISLIAIAFATYIIFGSFNWKQFEIKTETYYAGVSDWTPFNNALQEKYPNIGKDKTLLISFLSVGCSHCQQFAKKISFSSSSTDKVVYVFWAKEVEIEKFMKENGIQGPYLRLPQYTIMSIVGQQFPMFYEYKNGKPLIEYTGTEFSYVVFDKIFED